MSRWSGSDDTHFVTDKVTDTKVDSYAGAKGDSEHCHYYNNKETGDHGVIHRGSCKVCDDKSSGGK